MVEVATVEGSPYTLAGCRAPGLMQRLGARRATRLSGRVEVEGQLIVATRGVCIGQQADVKGTGQPEQQDANTEWRSSRSLGCHEARTPRLAAAHRGHVEQLLVPSLRSLLRRAGKKDPERMAYEPDTCVPLYVFRSLMLRRCSNRELSGSAVQRLRNSVHNETLPVVHVDFRKYRPPHP